MAERTSLILNALADPALVVRGGKIVYANTAAKRLCLSEQDDISALLPETALPADGAAHWETEFRGGRWEVTWQKLDGEELVLLRAAEKGEEDSALLRSVARGILRPLEQIMTAGSRLFPRLEELEDENIQKGTATISHAAFRLLRTVSSIHAFNRLEREDATLQIERCELSDLLGDLAERVKDILLDANVHLDYTGPGKAVFGKVDAQEVRRAVLNMISNAAKFPGESRTIALRATIAGKHLRITVKNDEEMAPDVLATAFRRHRAEEDGTDLRQETGLGLAVVQAVARRHGGSVVLESRNGATEVTLLLKLDHEPGELILQTPRVDYTGGYDPALVELSCVLPASTFDSRSVDL